MKKIFLLTITLLFLCSCDEKDGIGTDPKLNITNHKFGSEGGEIEVYSKKGHSFWFNFGPESKEEFEEAEITKSENGTVEKVVGTWYTITRNSKTSITIKVEANKSASERKVPISIQAGNYYSGATYMQAALN